MSTEDKFNGESELPVEEKRDIHHFVKPFSFEGWEGQSIVDAKPDFIESQAMLHGDLATTYQAQDKLELADEHYQKAQWWLGLEDVPPGKESYALDLELAIAANDSVVALLARAAVSKEARNALNLLTYRLLAGLNTLAANGNQDIADTLFSTLFRGVDDFNMLAYYKPEIFRSTARTAGGMPGIVASQGEKIEHNNELLKKLEVAQDNQFSIFRPGAKARMSTPANAWAVRLINHIDQMRVFFECAVFDLNDREIAVSAWVPTAVALPPLSPVTWQAWAAVGWEIIMEAAKSEPEKEPMLRPIGESAAKKQPKYGYEPSERTQSDNVRSKIKERITGAFRILANENDSPKSPGAFGGNES